MHLGDTMEEAENVGKRRRGRGKGEEWKKRNVRATIPSTLPSCVRMMCEKENMFVLA